VILRRHGKSAPPGAGAQPEGQKSEGQKPEDRKDDYHFWFLTSGF
jgi:hypothetical protein